MADTLVLTRREVERHLDMRSCIDALDTAFRADAHRQTFPAGVLATHVPRGGFHVKAAGLAGERKVYAAKINANFPGNPARHNLPTVQGALVLFDADLGRVLAVMDSISITAIRTAAASALAARYLAAPEASSLCIIGCGVQGRSHLRALREVRRLERVVAIDIDPAACARFCAEMSGETGLEVTPGGDPRIAARECEMIVTCTTSTKPVLDRGDVSPGAFIAAVGSDNESKQELAPALMTGSAVVVDVLEQCLAIGELHHAVSADAMTAKDVHATLAQVVAGTGAPVQRDGRPVVFDSTGTALEDVAAAVVAYDRAAAAGDGLRIALGG